MPENEPVAPSSFCTYFCRRGWPTKPRVADASEWPMSGIVPRNSGRKFFAADSRHNLADGLRLARLLEVGPLLLLDESDRVDERRTTIERRTSPPRSPACPRR